MRKFKSFAGFVGLLVLAQSIAFSLTPAVPAQAASFSDTTNYLWQKSVSYLQENGIVQGYDDGTFRPDQKINRAEFTKIIIGSRFASELNTQTATSCFPDTPANAWFTKYVCLAKEKGIIGGYSDGTFQPEKTINQAESLKILLLAFSQPISQSGGAWYQQYLDTAKNSGMLFFSPNNPAGYEITRGEMAYFTAWLMSKEKGITTDQLVQANNSSDVFIHTIDGQTHVVKMPANLIHMNVLSGKNSIRPKNSGSCSTESDCVAEAQAESFDSFVERSHKNLVVNGPFFDSYSKPLDGINFHQISSDIITNGQMQSMYGYQSAFGNGGMLAQMKDMNFKLYYPIREWLNDKNTINVGLSNYPLVLDHGHVRTKDEIGSFATNDKKFWLNAQRGGLALSADQQTVYYVSTVGTVEDLGKQMLNAGADSGFALDSGASNAFSLNGQTIFAPGRKLNIVVEFFSRDSKQ